MKKNLLPIIVMYLLFVMISFVTNLCNPMAVILKSNFDVSNFAAQLGNAANFIAYACMGIPAGLILERKGYKPLLFTDYDELVEKREKENAALQKERKIQEAMIDIKSRYGKNSIIKGTNLQEGATSIERNKQIGGHKA